MDTERARLGKLIEARIDELGLDYVHVAKRAGVSIETLAKARKGIRVSNKTLRRLEPVIGWTPLSADTVLQGGTPTLVRGDGAAQPSPPAGRLVDTDPLRDGEVLEWREGTAGHLRYTLTRTDPWARYGAEFTPDTDLESVVAALRQVIDIADVTGLGQKTR